MQRAPVESGIWGYVKNPTIEELDKPEEWYWLCPSCGELLRYTEHPAYPLHCEVRCRILHHMELGYVVSAAETQRQAVEAETVAYREWRECLGRLRESLLKGDSTDALKWRWDLVVEAARKCASRAYQVDGRIG